MSRWAAADDQLLHALPHARRIRNAQHRELLELVAEITARGLAAAQGFVTDIELLRCTLNVSAVEARRLLSAAADVLPGCGVSGEELPAPLPATAAAVAQDAISAEHIVVIQQILAALTPHLESHRAELESYLAASARVFDPPALRTLGKRRLEFLDTYGPKPRDGSPTRNRLSFAEDGAGFDVRGWLDRESAAVVRTALSPLSAPRPVEETGERDPRSLAERNADGLVELARRALDAGALPTEGGERPHITVTIPLTELESRLGNGLLDFASGAMAGAVSVADVRRWACDANVIPVVLGGKGEPLDVGRASRTVPRMLRRGLRQRDGGCAFPGCSVPGQWTDAHHIIHWAAGGDTSLRNLVLLCGRHHSVIHRGDWEVSITDGFPLFHPPPWIPGGPRRNTVHRIDLPRHPQAA